MSLLPFFTWCENSGLGGTIRSSSWLFPVIEAFLDCGANLLRNLRRMPSAGSSSVLW